MNKVILCGRFTREHVIRYLNQADAMTILSNSIAVGRKTKKDETDFINVKAFGQTAENINKYFSKGSLILIEGHIQTGSYENKEKQRVYTTEIVIDSFEFTDEKKRSESSETKQNELYTVEETVDNDDLPF